MSIEIRWTVKGGCECGTAQPIFGAGNGTAPKCVHNVECDWGVIEHPNPRPALHRVGPMVLITRRYVDELLARGGVYRVDGYEYITTATGSMFAHLLYGGKHWVWELFDAHFADGGGPADMMVGRWPD